MSDTPNADRAPATVETRLVHAGRAPRDHRGFVNTPVYRGSTVLFESLDALEDWGRPYRYGRQGTPLTRGLEAVITELEGAADTVLAPSGLAAVTVALMSCLSAGDDILVTDSAYEPTRTVSDTVLKRMGISVRYYDPRIGGGIADLIADNTRAIFTESPGSQTFEVQDLPAIAAARNGRDITLLCDNSWATPLYCRPLELGADIVIHAATKMFVGHSDAMFGTVSANAEKAPALLATHRAMGYAVGPDDTFLATRGMRTLAIRMQAHQERALELARWLEAHPLVTRVLHPGLESHPDHALFTRDFTGSGSLFGFVIPPAPRAALAAMVDSLELFGMGYSWGGFESLLLPIDPRRARTAVPWSEAGQLFRIHVGFEGVDDLKADLAAGFERYRKSAGL